MKNIIAARYFLTYSSRLNKRLLFTLTMLKQIYRIYPSIQSI